MTIYLLNAFSFNMFAAVDQFRLSHVGKLPAHEIAELAPFQSAIGHADMAAVISDLIGVPVAPARIDVQLCPGDAFIVAQYTGPRLPEGTTALPSGARVEFWHGYVLSTDQPEDEEEPMIGYDEAERIEQEAVQR